MAFMQWIVRSAVAGLVVPLLLTLVWRLVNSASSHSLSFEIALERLTLMVWPSSWALLAGAGSGSDAFGLKLLALAATINIVVYMMLGALLWYGLKRSHAALSIPIALVGVLWVWALFFR
jgi:hypothetical protein